MVVVFRNLGISKPENSILEASFYVVSKHNFYKHIQYLYVCKKGKQWEALKKFGPIQILQMLTN